MTRRQFQKVDKPQQREAKEGDDYRIELDYDQIKQLIVGQGSPEWSENEEDISKDVIVNNKSSDKPQKKSRFGSFFSSGSKGKKQDKETQRADKDAKKDRE